jgi:hypothetical protein
MRAERGYLQVRGRVAESPFTSDTIHPALPWAQAAITEELPKDLSPFAKFPAAMRGQIRWFERQTQMEEASN